MPRILITGGAGMIGQEIARQLLGSSSNGVSDEWEIFLYDDFSNPWTPKQGFKGKLLSGSIKSILRLKHFDVISHQASMVSVGKSMYNPEECFRQNVQFTAELIQAMIESEYKGKIILASSMGVYGNDGSPCSFYGLSKQYQEDMLGMYAKTYGAKLAILRYFSVYGMQSAENPYTGILSIIVNQMATQNEIELYEDGMQTRDMIHVRDVAKAHNRAIGKLDTRVYFLSDVSTGVQYALADIVAMVQREFASNRPVRFNGKTRAGDIKKVDSSNTVGTYTRLQDGIREYKEYLRDSQTPEATVKEENENLVLKGLVK